MLGDPGTAKSQLLKFVEKCSPIGVGDLRSLLTVQLVFSYSSLRSTADRGPSRYLSVHPQLEQLVEVQTTASGASRRWGTGQEVREGQGNRYCLSLRCEPGPLQYPKT